MGPHTNGKGLNTVEVNGDIDHEGIREFLATSGELKALLGQMADDLAKRIRVKAAHHSKTGRMAGKIKGSVIVSNGELTGKVTVKAPANLLGTKTGLRHQVTAWGNKVDLWHKADDYFVAEALWETSTLWGAK
jgi:hypothetical protein